MSKIFKSSYAKGFIPYALAAFLVGIVGGFTAVLAPAFVKDMGLAYNNTTWLSLALAMSTALRSMLAHPTSHLNGDNAPSNPLPLVSESTKISPHHLAYTEPCL